MSVFPRCLSRILAAASLFLLLSPASAQSSASGDFAQWTTIATALDRRAEGQLISYRGEYYLFSGFTTDTRFLNRNEKYNPRTNQWTPLSNLPQRSDGTYVFHTHTSITLVDDEIWHIGGRSPDAGYRVTRDVWIYNIPGDAWRRGPALPKARGGGGAARLGRTIHYVGGFDERSACDADDHFVYDLDRPELGWQDFSGTSPMPLARNHFGTVTLGGKLYTVAGQHGHDGCEKGKNLQYVHVYDPYTDRWQRLADFPHVQSHIEPSTFAYNGKIYSLGGQGQESASVAEYDPATNQWRILSELELPLRLIAPGARVHDGNLVVMTGGRIAVNLARDETRVRNFFPNQTRRLAFHPGTLKVSGTARRVTEVILANYSAEDATTYTIQTGDLPSWLSLGRTSGTARESFAEVELTTDPRGLAAGTYTYTLRATSAGYTAAALPITLTVGDGADGEGAYYGYREAECAEAIGSNWVEGSDAAASNGTYLVVKNGANSTATPPTNASTDHLHFEFDLPRAGKYQFFARVQARSTSDDSFWYRIDGGGWERWGDGLTTYDAGFQWRRSPRSIITLPAGRVSLDIAYREDGLQLDKILLASHSKMPSGKLNSDPSCETGDETEPEPPTSGTQEFWGEAECASYSGQWRSQQAGGASNGAYVYYAGPTQFSAPAAGTPPSDHVQFTTSLSEAGDYSLYLRLDAPDNSSNSFWIRVDDGAWIKFWKFSDGRNLLTNGFEWQKVNDDTSELNFKLSAGTHTITVANREAGTLLDKVYLTRKDLTPTGVGDQASNCGEVTDPGPPTGGAEDFWAEAECAPYGTQWRSAGSSLASNGTYISFTGPTQYIAPAAGTPGSEHVRFTATLAEPGKYDLFVRLNAPDNSRNSFWIRVDNGAWLKFWKLPDGRNLLTNGFAWHQVNDDTRQLSFDLTAGTHTITVANREAGTQLDKIYLTNTDTKPTAVGEQAENCDNSSQFAFAVPGKPAIGSPATPTIAAYPNPTTQWLTVEWTDLGLSGQADLILQDMTGRRLMHQRIDLSGGESRRQLDLTQLGSGVYQLLLLGKGTHLRTAVSVVR